VKGGGDWEEFAVKKVMMQKGVFDGLPAGGWVVKERQELGAGGKCGEKHTKLRFERQGLRGAEAPRNTRNFLRLGLKKKGWGKKQLPNTTRPV